MLLFIILFVLIIFISYYIHRRPLHDTVPEEQHDEASEKSLENYGELDMDYPQTYDRRNLDRIGDVENIHKPYDEAYASGTPGIDHMDGLLNFSTGDQFQYFVERDSKQDWRNANMIRDNVHDLHNKTLNDNVTMSDTMKIVKSHNDPQGLPQVRGMNLTNPYDAYAIDRPQREQVRFTVPNKRFYGTGEAIYIGGYQTSVRTDRRVDAVREGFKRKPAKNVSIMRSIANKFIGIFSKRNPKQGLVEAYSTRVQTDTGVEGVTKRKSRNLRRDVRFGMPDADDVQPVRGSTKRGPHTVQRDTKHILVTAIDRLPHRNVAKQKHKLVQRNTKHMYATPTDKQPERSILKHNSHGIRPDGKYGHANRSVKFNGMNLKKRRPRNTPKNQVGRYSRVEEMTPRDSRNKTTRKMVRATPKYQNMKTIAPYKHGGQFLTNRAKKARLYNQGHVLARPIEKKYIPTKYTARSVIKRYNVQRNVQPNNSDSFVDPEIDRINY